MKKILRNIPTNIITGFLGAGKTTVIRHLLQTKPANEKWAVLVNEFGEVGIDGALLSADGIAVKEVPGGCMCCAVGLPSKVALNQLIKDHQPDRLLIEPTGLAHPQQVVKQFSGPEYQTLLDMRAVVCLVDPWSLSEEKFLSLPAFHSQIELADVLVATKADVAEPQHLRQFDQFCVGLDPVKPRVGTIAQGQLDWQWLDTPRQTAPNPAVVARHHLRPDSAATGNAPAPDAKSEPVAEIQRRENHAEYGHSCGWLFPPALRFQHQPLLDLLQQLSVPRIKGLVQTDRGWHLINRMRTTVSVEELNPPELSNTDLNNSRLEMIDTDSCDWANIERQLRSCLLHPTAAGE